MLSSGHGHFEYQFTGAGVDCIRPSGDIPAWMGEMLLRSHPQDKSCNNYQPSGREETVFFKDLVAGGLPMLQRMTLYLCTCDPH